MKAYWYFEDFAPGQDIDLGTRTVTEEEIVTFAREYDPQPFHVDRDAAAHSIYGGVIASGWHTCGMMMRMVVDGLLKRSASMGSPGLDGVRWLAPVRAGDTQTELWPEAQGFFKLGERIRVRHGRHRYQPIVVAPP